MISVLVYGRNDNYGYNIQKRAALSLNCIAEALSSGGGDEIIFVDYNTTDELPTFPEAIRDTLTAKTKSLLRVLRVRGAMVRDFQSKTHLAVVEPVARNVGLRRSNPANRWVLSTNTDMIFVPQASRSLSDVADKLPDGFYHLPRFELPTFLWESLDRLQPGRAIEQVRLWGRTLHLNEVVLGVDTVRYDGPGDFQLMLRKDLFDLHGFDERMLLGWHVDANIARRMSFLHQAPGDFSPYFCGYHCEHSRQVTITHRTGRTENDWGVFVDDVRSPCLEAQAVDWGLSATKVEEVSITDGATAYVAGLSASIRAEMAAPSEAAYRHESFDSVSYDSRHVLPFLVDALSQHSPDLRIGWFGCRRDLLERFCEFRKELGVSGNVLVAEGLGALGTALPDEAEWHPVGELQMIADAFVFDFGVPATGEFSSDEEAMAAERTLVPVINGLRSIVRSERARIAGGSAKRRVITVNAIHNRFETLVREYIAPTASPFTTRLRHGYVVERDGSARRELLPTLEIGRAGVRSGDFVKSIPKIADYIVYGGRIGLDEGRYCVTLKLKPRFLFGYCKFEVYYGQTCIVHHAINHYEALKGTIIVAFDVEAPKDYCLETALWEFCIWSKGADKLSINRITLERLPAKNIV